MEIPAELLAAFPPSAGALLDLARRSMDDDMLRVVAEADYGLGADERFAELRPIRDTGALPEDSPFWLHEVLSLTRWMRVDPSDDDPPSQIRRHQIRAFACAVLLIAHARPDFGGGESDDSSSAILLASTQVLGEEWNLAAARFINWRITERPVESDELLFSLALLVLSVRLRPGRFSDRELGRFTDWVMAAEAGRGGLLPVRGLEPPPQLFSIQQGFWDPIVAELNETARSIPDEELRTALLLCSQLVEPEWR